MMNVSMRMVTVMRRGVVAKGVCFPSPTFSSSSFSTIIDLYEQKERAEENFYIKRMEKEQKEIHKLQEELKEKKIKLKRAAAEAEAGAGAREESEKSSKE
jgi:hypothetical protein